MELKIIERIHTDFSSRFGIPRQSGLVNSLLAKIVFEKPYRNPDAIRGLEGFSYLWLLWEFSECVREEWQPMVRPPKMDLNSKMGVFATRSPYRPKDGNNGVISPYILEFQPDCQLRPRNPERLLLQRFPLR